MRSRSRLLGAMPGMVCVIAAAIMFLAAFLPFIGWYGDGLSASDQYPNQVSTTLVAGSDAWLVFGTIAALGVVAICHVAGFRRRVTGLVALGASIVAAGLAVKLPGTWLQDGVTYGAPYLLDAGFYVFLGGALTSVAGAILMAATGLAGSRMTAERPIPAEGTTA